MTIFSFKAAQNFNRNSYFIRTPNLFAKMLETITFLNGNLIGFKDQSSIFLYPESFNFEPTLEVKSASVSFLKKNLTMKMKGCNLGILQFH